MYWLQVVKYVPADRIVRALEALLVVSGFFIMLGIFLGIYLSPVKD